MPIAGDPEKIRSGNDLPTGNSKDPEVLKARDCFDALVEKLPAPLLDHDGAPNEKNDPDKKREKRQKKRAKGE